MTIKTIKLQTKPIIFKIIVIFFEKGTFDSYSSKQNANMLHCLFASPVWEC
jgi:hypothetical protein